MCTGLRGGGDWGGGESGKKISVRCRDVFCHISRLTWTFLCLQAAERRGEERTGEDGRGEERAWETIRSLLEERVKAE